MLSQGVRKNAVPPMFAAQNRFAPPHCPLNARKHGFPYFLAVWEKRLESE